MKGLRKHIEDELVKMSGVHMTLAQRYGEAVAVTKAGIPPLYRVEIASRWVDEGEKGVVVVEGAILKQAIADAVKEFKSVNKRGDVQGWFTVSAVFNKGVAVPIPDKYWKKFIPAK